jgi:DNA-binding CsgD family transcriptional regulator/F0F1-type ATP synthase assembly protein I
MKATIKDLTDMLFRHQLKLEFFALFLLVFALGINIDNIHNKTPWADESFVAMLIVVLLLFITSVWMRVQKLKSNNQARDIKRNVAPKGPDRDAMVEKLSTRQKEIFELILLKMSNKEIMEELSIEQSSMRSHVSRIYKILQIKARKVVK